MKRYDEILENGFSSIFEDSDGEYVKYDDMVNLLKKLASDGGLDKDCMNLIIDALAEN